MENAECGLSWKIFIPQSAFRNPHFLCSYHICRPSSLRIDGGDGDLLLGVEADNAERVLGAQSADRTRTVCDIQKFSLRVDDKSRGLQNVAFLLVPAA